ncbi:MAG TPA: 1-deoxy-D-xylulose-5-phosphate reductoisomerase [Beijerinckiaceae bacterium]|jgi:1-deoxy-D-xylulose-5-phosphate reductoisomerase
MTRRITILGATGSIGLSTADVILAHRERFAVAAVVGGSNARTLAEVAMRLGASFAALSEPAAGAELKAALSGTGIAAGAGPDAVREAVDLDADIVVAAITGTAGLMPTHRALQPGRRIALANKETLVAAGAPFMRDARRVGATILPVDSEHNALRQALGAGRLEDVVSMTLTASGGPFRTWTREKMAAATRLQASAHPVWSMGAKINIDSASLMNKGLELIEAHHLFGLGSDRLQVLVHPQSIIHGLVQWCDGAVTAGLAAPDMRVPIANCLGEGDRLTFPAQRLDLAAIGSFTFEQPDETRFPCLRLARQVLAEGGAMPTVLNAANEVAVHAFIAGEIGFLDIPRIVESTCETCRLSRSGTLSSVEEALAIDHEARQIAREQLPRAARAAT